MDKLLMLTVIGVFIVFPVIGAQSPSPRRGLVRSLAMVALGIAAYTALLLFVAINFIDTKTPPGW